MPNEMLPPGYRAVLLGSAASIQGLSAVAPLEEGATEGALMLMRLDFVEFASVEELNRLETELRDAGVPPWPGYGDIVYADTTRPTVYLTWQKAVAWMPVIIGILIAVILPTLLGGFIWWLLPEPIKNLISAMVNVGIMILMMTVVSRMMPGLPAKPWRAGKEPNLSPYQVRGKL